MLSAPTASEIASASSFTSTNMSATDMETQQQLAIPIEASREKMTRSQPSSEVAQVDGDPASIVYQKRLAKIKTLLSARSTETDASPYVSPDQTYKRTMRLIRHGRTLRCARTSRYTSTPQPKTPGGEHDSHTV